jgi:hypothetical protein
MLINYFFVKIYKYPQRTSVPGGHLGADETVIQWYGKGGALFDAGLPMYLALERKPDNRGEIQNIADISSGIMLRLKVVKSTNEVNVIAAVVAVADAIADDDKIAAADKAGKGTKVLLELMEQ